MQVLKILSQIWKCGGELNLLSNGDLELNGENIPSETINLINSNITVIEDYLKSWVGADNQTKTMQKVILYYCGWQANAPVEKWLSEDNNAATLVVGWFAQLDRSGWKDIYDDFRQYENGETNDTKRVIVQNAIRFRKVE